MGAVDVKQTSEHELTLEWDSSASNDMIADSTLALITGIDKSPASVKRTSFTSFSSEHRLLTKTLMYSHLYVALSFPLPLTLRTAIPPSSSRRCRQRQAR